jgi:hypothetical protein
MELILLRRFGGLASFRVVNQAFGAIRVGLVCCGLLTVLGLVIAPLWGWASPENSQARKKSSEADGVTRYG